jgi:hypothetical protein
MKRSITRHGLFASSHGILFMHLQSKKKNAKLCRSQDSTSTSAVATVGNSRGILWRESETMIPFYHSRALTVAGTSKWSRERDEAPGQLARAVPNMF